MNSYKSFWSSKVFRTIELLIDLIMIIVSLILVAQINELINTGEFLSYREFFNRYYYQIPFMFTYLIVAGIFFILYQASVAKRRFGILVIDIFLSLFFTNIVLIVYSFVVPGETYFFSPAAVAITVILVQLGVFIIYKFFLSRLYVKVYRQHALIYGTKSEAECLLKEFLSTSKYTNRVKYIFIHDATKGLNDMIFRCIRRVNRIYITADVDSDTKNKLITYAALKNQVDVFLVPKTYEITMLGATFDTVDDTLVLKAQNMHLSLEQRFFKRTFDLVFSVLGLLLAAIPMLFVALLVKLQDGGPVFYKQQRFKRNNVPFFILKFRSMTHIQTKDDEQVHAKLGDKRITKIGKILRATRIDELPQLINILKGEMSFVGPRPLMQSDIDTGIKLSEDFLFRGNVKPGVTGLAQVYGRHDTSTVERLRYDLLYIRKYSFLYDIKLIFVTLSTVFKKEAGLGKEIKSLDKLLELNSAALVKVDELDFEAYELVKKRTQT